MRLLICDDNLPLVDALSMALTHLGHTVVATATDPDEAVAAAREHQPDACLLDIRFPRASGLRAIARIRSVSAGTKVVMLSGSISTELVADAIALGAAGFVGKEKPISVIVEALEEARRGRFAVDPAFLPDGSPLHTAKEDPPEDGLSRAQTGKPLQVAPIPVGNIQLLTREREGSDRLPSGDRDDLRPERRTRWHRPTGLSRPALRDPRDPRDQG